MLAQPYTSSAENEYDERTFVLKMKDEYVNHLSMTKQSYKESLLDVVKLDFERLADYIRFEALKKKKLLTIDRIKEILSSAH